MAEYPATAPATTPSPVSPRSATTLSQTIVRGSPRRSGRRGAYRRLVLGRGEPRLVHPEAQTSTLGRGARSLLRLVHLSDLQLADVESPGRFEFFQELAGLPGSGAFVPAQRPQEALAVFSCEVMARTLRRLGESPDTGAPLRLALSTGDNIDNAQENELAMFIALCSGGVVNPRSGAPSYEGVQSPNWPNPLYWHPDPGEDNFKTDWGFPELPGLIEQASAPFEAVGFGVPWLSCFGNHDGLVLGTAIPTPEYSDLVVGARKAIAAPDGPDLLSREAELLSHPERLLTGPARAVTPDSRRRIVGRAEFVAAHLAAAGLPLGHGYSEANVASETAYSVVDDFDGIRLVLLDTTNLDGYHHGSVGRRQMRWLEERLIEVHSRFRDADGKILTTRHADRLVVLASHHGFATLSNTRQDPAGAEDDHPRATSEEVRALLHRFGNVVLWLNGHRHIHEVTLWPSPFDATSGIWEVSTASMSDWPCQARVVEIVAGSDGTLSIVSTVIDHAADPDPDRAEALERLASLHRELAANDPDVRPGKQPSGDAKDRNVELVMRAPFVD
ncbi:MAG: TIGR03767 family metallophosphoesterase [Acidimicrobiales bacterium]